MQQLYVIADGKTMDDAVDKNEQVKSAVDGAINKVEDKVGQDLPSADDIIKAVKQ